ncbi:MAG: PEP-CTERM sorting domain-containing protein [Phycisphaerae bacterium]
MYQAATYACRRLRGGSFSGSDGELHASDREGFFPLLEGDTFGFRVSEVPEPTTIVMLALLNAGILRRKRP